MKSPTLTPAALAALGWLAAGVAEGQPQSLPFGDPNKTAARPSAPSTNTPAADVIAGDFTLGQREGRLDALLKSSLADGSLGATEYQRASAELDNIRTTEDRLRQQSHGELSDVQTYRLEGRIKTLASSLRWAR